LKFLLVYIAEAHAYDEWPVGDHYLLGRKVFQPRFLQERLELAQQFKQDFGYSFEVLVDDPGLDVELHGGGGGIGGGFEAVYAAWPTRFYLVDGARRISWIAQPDENHEYNTALDELADLLATRDRTTAVM